MKNKGKMGKGMISLRFALPAFFSLFLLLTAAAIFSVNFFFSMNSLEGVAFEYLAQTGTRVVERTVIHLEPAVKLTSLNSSILNPHNFNEDYIRFFNKITIPLRTWVEIFEKGLDAYFSQNWSEAYRYFSESVKIHRGDKASFLYLNRIKYYKSNPPPSNWDGVARYKKK